MAREVVLEYCAINIAAQPHPAGVYRQLLTAAALTQVNYWGDHYATISAPKDRGDGLLQGLLAAWTEIDRDEPAVRTDDLTEVDIADLDIRIPANVGFNGRFFFYTFRERDHTMFIEVKNELGKRLSPQRVESILGTLLAPETLGPDMPFVEVTLVPEEDALNRIFELPRLSHLEIHLVRPNADDVDVEEILAELDAQNARSMVKTLTRAPDRESLEPDARTTKQAEVAEFNGYVVGSGREADGNPIRLSTKEHPRIYKKSLDENASAIAASVSLAAEAIVRRRRRQDP